MPLLPIYGFGAIIMLLVTLPFPGNYGIQFCLGIIAPTILEYVTGWGMEKLFKMRYWDYSNQKFNLNGYICLTSSIAWGFFTLFMTNFLHPPIEYIVVNIINPIADYILVIGTGILFIIDTIESAKAALDVGKALEKLTELRTQLDDVQVRVALLKAEASQLANEKAEEAIDKVYAATYNAKEYADSVKTDITGKITGYVEETKLKGHERKEDIAERMTALVSNLNELNASMERITGGMPKFHRALLRGNPTSASKKFGNALKELKERYK